MSKRKPVFGYFRRGTIKPRWYWHLKSRNGRIICQSEGYNTKRACLQGISAVKAVALIATIIDLGNNDCEMVEGVSVSDMDFVERFGTLI